MSPANRENILKMVDGEKVQKNTTAKSCSQCKTIFSKINRKHHCRACGQVFCGSCSRKEMLLIKQDKENDKENSLYQKSFKSKSKQRVCQGCSKRLEIIKESKHVSKRLTFDANSNAFGVFGELPPLLNVQNVQNSPDTCILKVPSESPAPIEREEVTTPCFMTSVSSPTFGVNFQEVMSPLPDVSALKSPPRLSMVEDLMMEEKPSEEAKRHVIADAKEASKQAHVKEAPRPSSLLSISSRMVFLLLSLVFVLGNFLCKEAVPSNSIVVMQGPTTTQYNLIAHVEKEDITNPCKYTDMFTREECKPAQASRTDASLVVGRKATRGISLTKIMIKDKVVIKDAVVLRKPNVFSKLRFNFPKKLARFFKEFVKGLSWKNIARELSFEPLDVNRVI
jgi:hypothetical protein